jgi:hypothetical protein
MLLINPKGEYPRHIGDLQLAHKSWKIGDSLPNGWVEVIESPFPDVDQGKIVYEEFPIELDGVMTQNWQVREMTAQEIERRDAPANAKAKLIALGLTEIEIEALVKGLVR